MSSEILIYTDTSDTSTQDEITELLWKYQIPFYLTKKADEIEKKLKQKKYDLLVLIFKNHVPYSIESVISKNRNLSNLRRTKLVAIHQKYNDSEIQKSLMLGIKEISVEPCEKEKIIHLATRSFYSAPPIETQSARRLYFEIGPIPCKIDVFGRIGKIIKVPIGNLQIETNLILDKNEEINVTSRMSSDIGQEKINYSVLQSEGLEHYYNYEYSYILQLNSSSEVREALFKWTLTHDQEFTFPKTKLLWITDHLSTKIEEIIPKEIFSVYTLSENEFSYTRLERINPRIVVIENKNDRIIEILQSWEKIDNKSFKVVFNLFDKNHNRWEFIPNHGTEIFRQKFLTKIKDVLKVRVATSINQAHYMSRKSNYSRFATQMEGKIISTSEYQFKIELPHRITHGTIFRLHCSFLDDPSRSVIYARVINHHRYGNSGVYTHECSIVPDSMNPNQTLRELKILFDPKQKQKMNPLHQTQLDDELHFMKKNSNNKRTLTFWVYFFLALGAVIAAFVFILFLQI